MDLFETTYDEYLELCKQANWHNHLYFDLHKPVIEDSAYDALILKIKEIEHKHPEWKLPSSPTMKVGERTTPGFKSYPHTSPMLSLDKAFTEQEVLHFIKRIKQEIEEPKFSIEYKIDGCALAIWYEEGKLTRALTRGDGNLGDDVTSNILATEALPLKLKEPFSPFVELRAEVFMPYSTFEELNTTRQKQGLEPFANPRNATSGTLKLLDSSLVKNRGLQVAVYSASDKQQQIRSLEDSWKFIESQQLPTSGPHLNTQDTRDIIEFMHKAQNDRKSLNFGIDGVVIKLSDYASARKLGSTGQYYRWGIAYKFSPEMATTKLLDIVLQVGRTGVVTPVAILEPVFLDGSLISRCTLHNSDEIARKDIRKGDTVEIVKGGDIIPKIVRVDTLKREKDSSAFKMPLSCPVCGSSLLKEKDEVAWRCTNKTNCVAQVHRRLVYFVSKDAFDIEGLGKRTLEQLVELGKVHKAADLFHLTYEDLLALEGFADLSARKLLQALQERKQISLERLLVALNIAHLGVQGSFALAKAFGSLENLRKAELEEIMRLDGIGKKAAEEIYRSLRAPHPVYDELEALLQAGIEVEFKEGGFNREHPFCNKTFVLTGSLERYTRSSASKLIRERGGIIQSSVSSKTDYLLAGKEAGSKLEKAKGLGICIIDEPTFESRL